MPHLLLTTSISTGDLETPNTFDRIEVKYIKAILQDERIEITTHATDGTNASGFLSQLYTLLTTDYTALATYAGTTGETLADHMHKSAIQWLLDEGHYVGTLVP